MPNYEYTVTVQDEGGIQLTPTEVETEGTELTRTATLYDILDASRKIVADLERQIVLDGVNQMISALIPQPQPTTADVVKEALAKRAEDPVTDPDA